MMPASQRRTLLIAGGGTGGHVFPAIAIAREWLRRGTDAGPGSDEGRSILERTSIERNVVIVGTERGLESKLVPQANLPLEVIRVAGLKGIGGTKFLRNVALLPAGLWDSERIIQRHKFCAALGVGGYAAGPMILVAAMHRIPSVIFEPNVEPGFTNRVLANIATRVAVAHSETAEKLGRKSALTGCPIRPEFFSIAPRQHGRPFRVLITGGSRGAAPINRAVVEALDALSARKTDLFVVHQTGERDYNAVRSAYEQRQFPAEVLPFIETMADRFAHADLIVCRSGAITVAEISAAGRAAIFIPFGASTDAHQMRNAQAMQSAGAARLLPQDELTPARLATEIFSLLDQPQRLADMETRARALARPRAVEDIVDLLDSVAAEAPSGAGKLQDRAGQPSTNRISAELTEQQKAEQTKGSQL
ncbi:MAG TPA: UDP-N-acetylglucosamine--N-acetylmuramyl-(pentapeptide) pyrophosphoryl-undecaprenol N-acetylglucosamine transferase [Candidatus Acidoferrales bacterium]|nr:UDP-N-acetylglucosamine--N-acetylmuramyl-(pentapeptide) pyrophosphoryl-undecaprenol N-acetylglucosamine transferase [Candidatus Acidoferrales bacterium]